MMKYFVTIIEPKGMDSDWRKYVVLKQINRLAIFKGVTYLTGCALTAGGTYALIFMNEMTPGNSMRKRDITSIGLVIVGGVLGSFLLWRSGCNFVQAYQARRQMVVLLTPK